MGCLFRLGCLAVLAIAALVGWVNRDRLLGREPAAVVAPRWERLTPQRADRMRTALRRLEQPTGPAFVSFTGAEAASYVYLSLGQALPSLADSAEAAVVGDQLLVRGTLPLRELGGDAVLGPFAGMLGDREPVQIGGTLRVLGPGQGELRVGEIKVRDFRLPPGAVPRLLRMSGIQPVPGGSESAIPVTLPRHVGDVRVADGKITLYKTVP